LTDNWLKSSDKNKQVYWKFYIQSRGASRLNWKGRDWLWKR